MLPHKVQPEYTTVKPYEGSQHWCWSTH